MRVLRPFEEAALRQQARERGFELGLTAEHCGTLRLVGSGIPVAEVARRLHLSTRTAERRLAEARRLLGATTNAQAALSLSGGVIGDRANGSAVTRRQRAVLQLVADGLRDRDIAERLGISRSTVASLVASALVTLDAKSRTEAAARLAEIDDVGPPSHR